MCRNKPTLVCVLLALFVAEVPVALAQDHVHKGLRESASLAGNELEGQLNELVVGIQQTRSRLAELLFSVGDVSSALAQVPARKALRQRASAADDELSADLELREVRAKYTRLKAGKVYADSAQSRELLKRAGESLAEADAALSRGLMAKAQHFAYRAQRLLARAEQAARRSKGRDVEIEEQLKELTELIQRIRSLSSRPKSSVALEMLKRAEANLLAAKKAYRQGDLQKARRHLRAGRRAVLRSMEQSGG